MARKAAGEEPLPEEDPSNPIFKPIPEPSRLEGYLVTNQISSYCNHINGLDSITSMPIFTESQSCCMILFFREAFIRI
jgi:hypothetical protein